MADRKGGGREEETGPRMSDQCSAPVSPSWKRTDTIRSAVSPQPVVMVLICVTAVQGQPSSLIGTWPL